MNVRKLTIALLLALVATAATAAVVTRQLWAGSAASGAALDSGIVNTSEHGCVLVAIQNTGTVLSGACTVSMVRDDGTVTALGATFTVTAATTSYAGSVCPGAGTGFSAPVPRRLKVACVGVANAILSAVVEGR